MLKVEDIISKKAKVSIIGLGYVGLPIAVSFAKKVEVIGFDTNASKVDLYKKGIDPTKEVGDEELSKSTVFFTSHPADLKEARFHIIAVPTPINQDNTPDLSILESATRLLGQNMCKGSIAVFESTVYPGVTEDICVPILEKESGLVCGKDFWVGFSPERINPGDKENRLETIVKVVSGIDEPSLDVIAKTYEIIVEAGVHRASSIKVAEASKVIENAQRDINIAFMNELSVIFKLLGVDTLEVLEAAGTKWNFLKFVPGLVGGHCIAVDPYYLTHMANRLGYHPQVILSGRRINDNMGRFVAENTVKQMIAHGKNIQTAKVAIFGLTFKENCPDTRNSGAISIINELNDYGITPLIYDPIADKVDTKEHYGIDIVDEAQVTDLDCVIFAVGHTEFKTIELGKFLKKDALLVDVKSIFDRSFIAEKGYKHWRL